ncbi:hypothetical protein MJN85_30720, partial [Salmonella enterica subsp. enterica serovar Anatum]|nr:hypothetical protein [Salmonella enterica subsp. enterica serovar Anatum]
GHPIGASGCRILVSLVHEMVKRDARKGLATLCIGGGQGVALTTLAFLIEYRLLTTFYSADGQG